MNYIYDLPQGWVPPTSKDKVFNADTIDRDALASGYKLSSTLYTNFFTVRIFEGKVGVVPYPWVLSVKSPLNSFVVHTTNLPAFLDCCAKLLIKDVSA